MKSFREFLAEAEAKQNATGNVTVELYGGTITVEVSNIKNGPDTNWGENITGLSFEIKDGATTLPWPLLALAGINSTNSPVTLRQIPGASSGSAGDLWYDGSKVKDVYIMAGDQQDYAEITKVSMKDSSIFVTFSKNSNDLKGKYKKFSLEIKLSSLFGSKADAIVDELSSKDWKTDEAAFLKLTRTVKYKNTENAKLVFDFN